MHLPSLMDPGDGLMVWRSTLTVLVLGKNRKKGAGGVTAAAPRVRVRESGVADALGCSPEGEAGWCRRCSPKGEAGWGRRCSPEGEEGWLLLRLLYD